MDTRIFRSMSYGVYVAGTMDGDRPTGCIVNSIMQITSSPATVAVSVNHDNYTNSCIAKSGLFSFSILAEDSDPGLIGGFGFRSGKDVDKFEGVDYQMAAGCPVVKDSCGYVVCRVINTMETATHTVFLGEVIDGVVHEGGRKPMTYAYYHQVVKGKSPKNAPTYLPEEDAALNERKTDGEAAQSTSVSQGVVAETKAPAHWKCQICGYVYEGEELPADFHCPWCKQSAENFRKEE